MTSKKIEKICKQCQGKFMSRKSTSSEHCSKACLGKTQTGENNPNWKGGISKNNTHYTNLFRERHPEKANAHDLTADAIKKGLLIRQPCEVCKTTENIQAHHEDYSKPLSVRWLCRQCHNAVHRKVDPLILPKRKRMKIPIIEVLHSDLPSLHWANELNVPVVSIQNIRGESRD